MGTKRKKAVVEVPSPPMANGDLRKTPILSQPKRGISSTPVAVEATSRRSRRGMVDANPEHNEDVLDGQEALRASPDAIEVETHNRKRVNGHSGLSRRAAARILTRDSSSESSLSDLGASVTPPLPPLKKARKAPTKSSIAAKKGSDEIKAFKLEQASKKAAGKLIKQEGDEDDNFRPDPEADDALLAEGPDAERNEAYRPPPVNSGYLPLPWKGRLGYACLNTYLRYSHPPVFSSRTCRIASILEHRHPLKDPSQPEHPAKNRPNKDEPADITRGQRFVEQLGLANARDIPQMLRWNEKYGIRFLRLSSEMFPFASHEVYGYKLAPFAAEALAEAGRVAAELGHRLTTHPGQFTQLGSPRPEVIKSAIRDLEYHNELLSLLKLPPQQDRDAVLILHLGGTFGDKTATLTRFRTHYATLSPSIKRRLVLENDDVSWSVHDLLPLCESCNIPLVLDFHHHNIVFDASQVREGTQDITGLFPRIAATWSRKGITQKMHYSEPTPGAITRQQRRRHSARVGTLPPCPADMDLMIEAKDKEQAVLELMRNFRLPGWEKSNAIVPFERGDDFRVAKGVVGKKKRGGVVEDGNGGRNESGDVGKLQVTEEERGMGGPQNRVYWPLGMEEWLRPRKRVGKAKAEETTSKTKKDKDAARRGDRADEEDDDDDGYDD